MSSCFLIYFFVFSSFWTAWNSKYIEQEPWNKKSRLGWIVGNGFQSGPNETNSGSGFCKKPQESFNPNLYFNKFVVEKVQTQKHLGLKLDKILSFKHYLKDKFAKVNRAIGILTKLKQILTRPLITLYKPFIRPHLVYADIIYEQPNNLNLCIKLTFVSTMQL